MRKWDCGVEREGIQGLSSENGMLVRGHSRASLQRFRPESIAYRHIRPNIIVSNSEFAPFAPEYLVTLWPCSALSVLSLRNGSPNHLRFVITGKLSLFTSSRWHRTFGKTCDCRDLFDSPNLGEWSLETSPDRSDCLMGSDALEMSAFHSFFRVRRTRSLFPLSAEVTSTSALTFPRMAHSARVFQARISSFPEDRPWLKEVVRCP
jgi:hypothetical protein